MQKALSTGFVFCVGLVEGFCKILTERVIRLTEGLYESSYRRLVHESLQKDKKEAEALCKLV